MLRLILWSLFCSILPLSAMLVGNPGQPDLETTGVIIKRPFPVSFRAGYLDDWVYHQSFQAEPKPTEILPPPTSMILSTYAGLLTLNFANRFDLYGLVGSSRMQVDKELFTKRAVSWGVGGKLIIYREGNFYIGTDFKYFETNQKPRYFVVEGLPYNVVTNMRLQYHEVQAAIGMAYRIWILVPYINATYLIAKMEPNPLLVLVRFPDGSLGDAPLRSVFGQERWGMTVGLSFVDNKCFAFGVEWRGINQNAVDWNFEFRF